MIPQAVGDARARQIYCCERDPGSGVRRLGWQQGATVTSRRQGAEQKGAEQEGRKQGAGLCHVYVRTIDGRESRIKIDLHDTRRGNSFSKILRSRDVFNMLCYGTGQDWGCVKSEVIKGSARVHVVRRPPAKWC
jgi:hypothetical protein